MASSKPTQRILTQGKKLATLTNKKPERTVSKDDEDSDENQGESSDKTNRRPKIIRPNAFLSFRITNPEVENKCHRMNDLA